MIYVALLRGINVGGNNMISMKKLKASFERIGLHDVTTYINSGNIIFTDEANNRDNLVEMIEGVLLSDFQLAIRIVLRDIKEMKQLNDAIPAHWQENKDMRSVVLFLWDEVDSPDAINELSFKEEIEQVQYVSGAILWSVARANLTKSGMSKIIGSPFYKLVTIRNVNTVRKLYQLMNGQ